MAPLTTVDAALAAVLDRVRPLPAEQVSIDHAAGRVLAGDVRSPVDLPLFASSAMDGVAVRAADTPGVLPIVGRVAAGRPFDGVVPPGAAVEIATGGVVPTGADAVAPVEIVERRGGDVIVPSLEVGANVRPRGGDVAVGELVQPAGTVVSPARLAAIAACGVAVVACGRRPHVAVLTTGTELRAPGEELRPGEIYESNGAMLAALLDGAGCRVTRLRPAADEPETHHASLEEALEADVVVTSGGVSVGPHDLVRSTLASLGVEEVFWGVAMRPGKPLAFGVRGDTLVFGLPGNPVSSLVGAMLFVVPAVTALQGAAAPGPHFHRGLLAVAAERRPSRDDFVRVTVGPDRALTPIARQESHMIVSASVATALARIPAGDAPLPEGSPVDYLPLERAGA
ncbi:MAG: molybdopterin molybdotransferase MoeA [Gaiella sp.]